MTADPLATFIELLERTAPEIAKRMRPAPAAKIAELVKVAPPLPPEYLRFLELMGGNKRGELAPFMPDDAFDIDHAIASYVPEESHDDDDDDDDNTPFAVPEGWVFLCQRFHEDPEFPMYKYHQ